MQVPYKHANMLRNFFTTTVYQENNLTLFAKELKTGTSYKLRVLYLEHPIFSLR